MSKMCRAVVMLLLMASSVAAGQEKPGEGRLGCPERLRVWQPRRRQAGGNTAGNCSARPGFHCGT